MACGSLWKAEVPHIALVTVDGRCLVLWKDEEGAWQNRLVHQAPSGLSAVAIGDADPGAPGPDLIVGTGGGQVLSISERAGRDIVVRLIFEAKAPISDLAVHDFNSAIPGDETLVLSEDGKATLLWPVPESVKGEFESLVILQDTGRLRNVLAGPYGPQNQAGAVVVGTSGNVTRLHAVGNAWRVANLYQNPEPLARIAGGNIDPTSETRELIIADDAGLITILHQNAGGYIPQAVYKEEKALRGVAAGELDPALPGDEFAVFGYGMEVAMFSRMSPEFNRTMLFKDSDKGHWLIACQLDMQNQRHELIAVGYSGKVTLIDYH
ncbi:MAG: hypothetical protein ABIK28_07870 [Planctomycetota bacterium]